MTPEEAMAELQNGASNGQFDLELVESFVEMLGREDPVAFAQKAHDADFETELEFERRVRDMAEPRSPDGTTRSGQPHRLRSGRRDWRAGVADLKQRVLNKE
jgi:hypothetical protein